jgi:hypothetical protein
MSFHRLHPAQVSIQHFLMLGFLSHFLGLSFKLTVSSWVKKYWG